MSRISIFIPVYHRDETVKVAVSRILETMGSDGFDVRAVLVDNRSGPELRAWLASVASSRDDVELMLLSKNFGKADAINRASRAFDDFDYFINCDSDISPQSNGWPAVLAQCFEASKRAGMISTDYDAQNSPMPKQPKEEVLKVASGEWKFQWGGQVAGGCFLTSAAVWKDIGYRASGVYGGVDGIFRQNVADSLMRQCGYIEGLLVNHMDDRKENEDYHAWKMKVQSVIRERGPLAKAEVLGNEKGFWDK